MLMGAVALSHVLLSNVLASWPWAMHHHLWLAPAEQSASASLTGSASTNSTTHSLDSLANLADLPLLHLQVSLVALLAGANLENLSADLQECVSGFTSENGASRTASSDEADLVHHTSDLREQLAAKPQQEQQPGSARASGEQERAGAEGRLHKVPHAAQQGAEQHPQGLLHVSADTRSQPLSPTQQPPTPQVQHGQRPPSQLGTSRPASVVAGSSEGDSKQIALG